MALRFDAIRLDASKIQRLGSGAVRVPGLLTRSGVFEYTDSSGKTIREWRPPEEVLKADSLASLKDLPVTERHPKSFVDPGTWKSTAIGHVSSETVRADKSASGVDADLVISDGSAIGRIGKDLKEISCGYRVEIEDSAGIVPAGMPDAGKSYDRIQRDIFHNHVAIGPANWGRQGSAVSLRLDSAGDEIAPAHEDAAMPKMKSCDCGASMKYDAATCPNCSKPARKDAAEQERQTTMKIRFDGVEFEGATEQEIQAKIDAHVAGKAKTDSAKELERLRGENETLKTQATQEKARADAAPALAKAALESRTKLEESARAILGNAEKFDGKTDREIRVAAIVRCDAKWTDLDAAGKPKSDEKVDGAFEAWVAAAAPSGAPRVDAASRALALGLAGASPDGKAREEKADANEPDADAARKRRDTRMAERGRAKRTDQTINGKPVKFG